MKFRHMVVEFHGASWEGYIIEEVLKLEKPDEAYFRATHQGAEIDLLMFKNRRKIGVEIKYTDAPTMTPSIRNALVDLQLDRMVVVVYPGEREYLLDDRVRVMPMTHLSGNRPSFFSVARSHG